MFKSQVLVLAEETVTPVNTSDPFCKQGFVKFLTIKQLISILLMFLLFILHIAIVIVAFVPDKVELKQKCCRGVPKLSTHRKEKGAKTVAAKKRKKN